MPARYAALLRGVNNAGWDVRAFARAATARNIATMTKLVNLVEG